MDFFEENAQSMLRRCLSKILKRSLFCQWSKPRELVCPALKAGKLNYGQATKSHYPQPSFSPLLFLVQSQHHSLPQSRSDGDQVT
jgi:hypothetical protein